MYSDSFPNRLVCLMAGMNNVYSDLGLGEKPKVTNYSPQMVECFTAALEGVRVKLDEGARDYPGDPFSTAIVLGEILYLRHVRKQDWSRLGDEDLMRLTSLGRYQVRVAIAGLRALGLIEVDQKSRRSPRDIRLIEGSLKDLVSDPRARALRANESARSARAESARSARAESARSARAIEEDLGSTLFNPLPEGGEGDSDLNPETKTGSDEFLARPMLRAFLARQRIEDQPIPEWAIEAAVRRETELHTPGPPPKPKGGGDHSCEGLALWLAEHELINDEAREVVSISRARSAAARGVLTECPACDPNGFLYDDNAARRCTHTDDERAEFEDGQRVLEVEQV